MPTSLYFGAKWSFNSRTPGGVRRLHPPLPAISVDVSIHAPREGCDSVTIDFTGGEITFQFTHPGRGATKELNRAIGGAQFQFTHPGRGATRPHPARHRVFASFNSRTPGGVRLGS